MKQIIATDHGGSDVLTVTQTAQPEVVDRTDIKVQLKASGINYTSVEKRRGNYRGVTTGWDVPYDTGMEGSGVITETGDAVEGWSVGDRVGMIKFHGGTWQEYTTVSLSRDVVEHQAFAFNPDTYELLFALPEQFTYEEGAAIPLSFLTAYGVLSLFGGVTDGDNVLIHSVAGGVGTAAVQIANQYDVTTFGLASSQQKLQFARRLGLDHPIDYTEANTVAEIRGVLGRDGSIDLALDSLGGQEFKRLLEVMGRNGNIVTYGVSSGVPGVVSTPKLIFDNISVHGFHLLTTILHDQYCRAIIDGFAHTLRLFESDEIHIEIDAVFDMEEISAAHDYLEKRNSMGSLVMDIGV